VFSHIVCLFLIQHRGTKTSKEEYSWLKVFTLKPSPSQKLTWKRIVFWWKCARINIVIINKNLNNIDNLNWIIKISMQELFKEA